MTGRPTPPDPLDECPYCDADLFPDVPHECPVAGNLILVTLVDGDGDDWDPNQPDED